MTEKKPETTEEGVSRRQFLKIAGVAGGGALGWAAIQSLPLSEQLTYANEKIKNARQWAMVIDLRKCDGCVSIETGPQCVEACNLEHYVPEGQEWLKMYEMEMPGGGTSFLPMPCMHCENAPCLNVCPVGATFRDEEGVILIDHNKCIGCRLCMAACPYGARSFNWTQPENPPSAALAEYSPEFPVPHRKGTVEKCMFCVHRTGKKLPACADGCPMNAIYFGDLVEDIATNGAEVVQLSALIGDNDAFRLKEELGTQPRVWYIPGHGQEYGRTPNDKREMKKARTWKEQQAGGEGA